MWGDLRTIKSLVFPAWRDLADSLLPQINLVIHILKWARLLHTAPGRSHF